MRAALSARLRAAALLGLVLAFAPGLAPAQGAEPAAGPASAVPTHRPLRDNRPPGVPEPTDPQVFDGYAAAPAFTVVPRKGQLALYPCSQCHKVLPLNTQPRKLVAAPHPAALQHGNGRFWCLDCHQAKDRDVLHAVGGAAIDFDRSDQLCGQCHGTRHRDWAFGAHGKRVAVWQGERQLYACTHCHDPHNPLIAPRAPSRPPPVRAGLAPMVRVHDTKAMPWQKTPEGPDHAAVAKP